MGETLKLVYTAAKVRLGFLIMLCALAGFAVSPNSDLTVWQVVVLGLTVLLCSSSAGAFNAIYERDIDARMKRTRTRPFVTGQIEPNAYWLAAIVLITLFAVLALALVTNAVAAFFLFLGAFFYGVVYTVWLKRRTWWNVVVGGAAGSFAVMAGAAAVDAAMEPAPLILALVLFLWTPPHFWALAYACKKDYQNAGIPMLPVLVDDRTATLTILINAVVVSLLSLVPVFYGLGWIYLLGAASGGVYFVQASLRLARKPGIQLAWRTFGASIVQLGLMLTAAIVDRLILG